MSALVDVYQFTVPQLLEAVGDEVITRWESLAETETKIQWAYGREADALIPEFPAMIVYKAIAVKTGKSAESIRKYYYTYKAFTDAEREKYEVIPYSFFAHARLYKAPIEVLDYCMDKRASLDEIERVFPVTEYEGDKEFDRDFTAQGFSRIFYGVWREIYAADPFLKARAVESIKELEAIIKELNK
jgi:hypothetical protein